MTLTPCREKLSVTPTMQPTCHDNGFSGPTSNTRVGVHYNASEKMSSSGVSTTFPTQLDDGNLPKKPSESLLQNLSEAALAALERSALFGTPLQREAAVRALLALLRKPV